MAPSSVGSVAPLRDINATRTYKQFLNRGKKLIEDGNRYRNMNVNYEGKKRFDKIVKDLKNLVQDARKKFKEDGGANNADIKVKDMEKFFKKPFINNATLDDLKKYMKNFLGVRSLSGNKYTLLDTINIDKLRNAVKYMISRENIVTNKDQKEKMFFNILHGTLSSGNIGGHLTRGRLESIKKAVNKGKSPIKNFNGASSSGSSP